MLVSGDIGPLESHVGTRRERASSAVNVLSDSQRDLIQACLQHGSARTTVRVR